MPVTIVEVGPRAAPQQDRGPTFGLVKKSGIIGSKHSNATAVPICRCIGVM
jgi:hypothetical protein